MSVNNKQSNLFSTFNVVYFQIKKIVNMLSASFWFLPSLMIVTSIIMAISLQHLDYTLPFVKMLTKTFTSLNSETSQILLQVIATSVITVTSIAFSMTLVALTMASNQFGPRLIRRFMEDKRTQLVLGFFTGTFVYCLLVLGQMNIADSFSVVPIVSVLYAKLLAIICVFTLIYFIHHVAISIQADNVIDDVASTLNNDLRKLQQQQQENRASGEGFVNAESFTYHCKIVIKESGYVQAIEYESLVMFAQEHSGMLEMHVRAGKYVFPGTAIATMHSETTLPTTLAIDRYFILGKKRTPLQDPQFAINQLVEMALRALSPSLNDPFTAISCIDKLASALATFTPNNIPQNIVLDNKQEVRVLTDEEPFEDLFAVAFNQIRQNSDNHVAVSCHLLDVFNSLLLADEPKPFLKNPIATQINAIKESIEFQDFSNEDTQALEQRLVRCMQLTEQK